MRPHSSKLRRDGPFAHMLKSCLLVGSSSRCSHSYDSIIPTKKVPSGDRFQVFPGGGIFCAVDILGEYILRYCPHVPALFVPDDEAGLSSLAYPA